MKADGTKRRPAIHHDGIPDGARLQIRIDSTHVRTGQGHTNQTGTGPGLPQSDIGCEELGSTG